MKSSHPFLARSTLLSLALSIAGTLLLPQPQRASGAGEAAPVWQSTGRMRDLRVDHTSSLLSDGRVLVAGGGDGSAGELSSARAIFMPSFESMRTSFLIRAVADLVSR